MKEKSSTTVITVASVVGIVLALPGLLVLGLDAIIILTLLPILCTLGLLIKKWWICGVLYIIIFIAARTNIFSGEANLLAIILCIGNVVLFAFATKSAFDYQKSKKGSSANDI